MLGAFALGGCEMHPPSSTFEPTPGAAVPKITSPSLKIAADNRARLGGEGSKRFHLPQVRNLQFRLQVGELGPGVTWVTTRLYTPSGVLHHTRHTPYSTDPSIKTVPSPHGVPHPIDVVQATEIPGGYGLDHELLVGGTNLVRHPLPGSWKVRMEREDQPDVFAETQFELAVAP